MSAECRPDFGLPESYRMLREELSIWARLKRVPLSATFELTPFCNLNCPMCYVHLDPATAAKQGKILSGKQWLEIAAQAKEMGLLFVTLSGGEPFLHPDFWEIYNGLTEMGILVDIYSNGCLINEGIVEKLKANPPVNMKISMYGASDETYEAMCRYKNGFTKLDRALGLLREAGLPFYCTSLVVNENLHDLAAMYEYTRERKIRFFHTISVASSVRESINTAETSKINLVGHNWTLEGLEKERHTRRYLDPFQLCAGYGITMFMTWHGHLQFCAFSPKPYVQMGYGAEMASAWKELLAMTDQIQTPKECETCEWHEFCRRCPGLMASESGDPNVLSPKFCQQAKDLYHVYQKLKAAEGQANAGGESENKQN